MKNLRTILYGLSLCVLMAFMVKYGRPATRADMVLVPTGDGMDAFYMDVYEVTNAAYKKFIDANPQWQKDKALVPIVGNNYLPLWDGNTYPAGKANHPVTNISWFAAKAYAEWVGKDLPTEAQWEIAARGISGSKKYAWSDTVRRRANYDHPTMLEYLKDSSTKEVGSYLPDEYGLYDIVGNVKEWCRDRLDVKDIHGRYHRTSSDSWFDSTKNMQIAKRSQHPVDDGMSTLGFRCVMPTPGMQSIKVATDMASWLYDEMQGQFDSAHDSVSEGHVAYTNLDAKFDEIVMNTTGYHRTFERELISVLREVESERMASDPPSKNTESNASNINRDLTLQLWKLYLEVHFAHGDESIFQKLRRFKANVRENIDSIVVKTDTEITSSEWARGRYDSPRF